MIYLIRLNKYRISHLFLCLLFLCLIGCNVVPFQGLGLGSVGGKITITLWYWNRSIDDTLIARVEQHFPRINFRPLKIGGGYDTKLRTSLAGHANIPDIAGINSNIATYFPDEDQFVDLRTLATSETQKSYLDWKWHLGTAPDGRVMALPMDTGPTALFYRADLFKRAGLPFEPQAVAAQLKNWDDYTRAGEQMQRATHGRMYMFDNINNIYNQIMAQSSLQLFDATNHYIGKQSHVKRAWDYAAKVHRLALSAKATSYSTDWSAAISNGSVASFVGAVWMKHRLQDTAPATAGLWRVAKAPGGPGSVGGSFLAVMKASEHPKEAFEIARWLMSPDNQVIAYQHTGLYPSAIASLNSPRMLQPEPFFGGQITTQIFSQAATHVLRSNNNANTDAVQYVLQRELTAIEMQNVDPQSAWDTAQAQIQRELSH